MPSYLSELNLDGTNRQLRDRLAVSTEASQSLTNQQKAHARENIGVDANFKGTKTQWDALTTAQKAYYDTVDII